MSKLEEPFYDPEANQINQMPQRQVAVFGKFEERDPISRSKNEF
jgi:hypothetical protein